jgi:hypothetical protein
MHLSNWMASGDTNWTPKRERERGGEGEREQKKLQSQQLCDRV